MPKTYTIAVYRDDLLACVPDGTPLAPYIENMQRFYDKPIFPLAVRVETGLTLTDEAPDDNTFPGWDARWSTMDVQLQDETGRVFEYAVRQSAATDNQVRHRATLMEQIRLIGIARKMLSVSIRSGTINDAGEVTAIALVAIIERATTTLWLLGGLGAKW
jgi:hypothetical protein